MTSETFLEIQNVRQVVAKWRDTLRTIIYAIIYELHVVFTES